MDYTLKEMMTIIAAREIRNDDIVFCGTGISMLAAMAAKNINAPESVIFFETGALDSRLEELPLAVGDSRVMYKTSANGGLLDSFAAMQNPVTGRHVIGILGAAQIDKFGNLNSTVIGDYHSPEIRFSGSGGGCDVASFVPRSIIFMQHEKRKFVNRLDYLTSPGYIDGKGGRKKAGLPDGGPIMVITNLAVMRFDETTKEMYLSGVYPGITPERVLMNMEIEVDISRVKEEIPPSEKELRLLREKCDHQRLIL
ncbi:MAG: ketoacid-CoA transferase [Desulfobacterales bacterium RIFOXYA12_FULL_46_15]|nr:MAG: ketoacid-CoA transferase [Desulfobacterales bacterium RIFOXYA12_FULL_46_15]